MAAILIHDGWMELQQLRYVLAVAEERSFTRAAERCHIVQSAMSHQIKALEREIGMRLFARTSRRVDLTAAGEAFLPSAQASVEAAERAIVDASAATGELRGTLTIGVIPTVTAIDIPAALRRFRRKHPAVRVRLRGGGSDEFMAAIAAGTMDVAVLGLPTADRPVPSPPARSRASDWSWWSARSIGWPCAAGCGSATWPTRRSSTSPRARLVGFPPTLRSRAPGSVGTSRSRR